MLSWQKPICLVSNNGIVGSAIWLEKMEFDIEKVSGAVIVPEIFNYSYIIEVPCSNIYIFVQISVENQFKYLYNY